MNASRPKAWPHGGPPPGILTRVSFCGAGDNDTGWVASEPLVARSSLPLYVIGYPGTLGVRMAVENLASHRQLPLQFAEVPGETWRLYYFPLPRQWRGQSVRVLAADEAKRPAGWLGFAEMPPLETNGKALFGIRLLALALWLLVVTILPAVAACVVAVLRGVRNSLDLIAIALLTIGFVGYAAFWIYFLNQRAGVAYSYVVLRLSSAITVRALLRRGDRMQLAALRPMMIPLLSLAAACIFMVCIGFLYGKPDLVQDYAVHRFGPPYLSIDNFLPKLLADGVYKEHIPKPMAGDWLSSDRPPLQAGMALWHYAWTHGDRDLPYQVLGIIFQLTFLVGLWAYLDAAAINRKAMALVMAASLFSGFTIFNSFFVWPKLLPAAFLLLICGYLFTERYGLVRSDWRVGLVVGSAAALAMLCHGGSFLVCLV